MKEATSVCTTTFKCNVFGQNRMVWPEPAGRCHLKSLVSSSYSHAEIGLVQGNI